ncbi:RHS repeat domain-containing protein [Coprobacter tertius]|uniref:RHS repeat-associated core domain-containing protein n=1 Tax=Coprobacter tertius TaxID=2944915 RepID=A0ABT1MFP9_9BACT|nr:RHS repeat-associated core domain-containing protein [Coprobacter tertius]MCP9610508.1 hypothetical protein [Coprobacter tertius]
MSYSKDYIGNKEYVNGRLSRIDVPGGYIKVSGATHKVYGYQTDYLGSNRVVLDAANSSNVVQYMRYYPFGLQQRECYWKELQPYKYSGKEYISFGGLECSDFGARLYDQSIGRWMCPDPLAEKYYSVSPYVYCMNNPMSCFDMRGDSVTILNLGTGTNQHMAMLIQNDAGKWQYYSVNGDNVYSSGNHVGGRTFDDLGIGVWDSPQQFLNSDYNKEGDKEDKHINSYGYIEGYILPTDKEQDKIIKEKFLDISVNEEYGIISNNCATVVQRSLNAAGIKTDQIQKIPANKFLGESSFTVRRNPFIPSIAFKTIMKNNMNGIYIKKL